MTQKTFNLKVISFLEEAYKQGYACAIFTPEELNGVSASKVVDRMIESGSDYINFLKRT